MLPGGGRGSCGRAGQGGEIPVATAAVRMLGGWSKGGDWRREGRDDEKGRVEDVDDDGCGCVRVADVREASQSYVACECVPAARAVAANGLGLHSAVLGVLGWLGGACNKRKRHPPTGTAVAGSSWRGSTEESVQALSAVVLSCCKTPRRTQLFHPAPRRNSPS